MQKKRDHKDHLISEPSASTAVNYLFIGQKVLQFAVKLAVHEHSLFVRFFLFIFALTSIVCLCICTAENTVQY